MKRSFFYLAVGALALTACTSENLLEEGNQTNSIRFQNVVSKQSRDASAEDLEAKSLLQFNVFGYYLNPNVTTQGVLVFNNVPVKKKTDENNQIKWMYDDIRYWVPNASYYFYAYSCGNISKLNSDYGTFSMDVNASQESDRVLKIHDYICDASHQHDLLFASATGIRAEANDKGDIVSADDVAFKFSHLLSKIETKFTSEFPPQYIVEIKNVRATNIRNIGDYWPGKDWSNQERKNMEGNIDPYVQIHGTNIITAQKGGTITNVDGTTEKVEAQIAESEAAFVLPYTYSGAEVTLSFEITVKAKDAKGELQTILGRTLSGSWKPTWQTGYWYTYTISITGDATNLKPIMFTTAVDPITGWTEGETPSDITFSAN